MPEYIEREATIKELNKAPCYFNNGDICYGIQIAIDIVEKQPTVDVAEVKHGEWTTTETMLGTCCVCSICGSCPTMEYNYCPYCGANMGGKEG